MESHSISDNHFEILGLPVAFEISESDLESAYLRQQMTYHPDRFVKALPGTKALASECSQKINRAYALLKDPLTRAQALLQAWGVSTDQLSQRPQNMELLMDVMAWRQRMDSALTSEDVLRLKELFEGICEKFARLTATSVELLEIYVQLSYYGKLYHEARTRCTSK